MNRKIWLSAIRFSLILLFVYTGLNKLLDWTNFQKTVQEVPLLANASLLVALGLPLIELSAAALLFFPATVTRGLWLSLLLMTTFTVYLGYMIRFMPHLPCNCGGVIKQLSWKQHFILNLFITLLCILGIRLQRYFNFLVATNRPAVQRAQAAAENL